MTKKKFPISMDIFLRKMIWNLYYGLTIIIFSLLLGMIGYHHFEKMNWTDAYLNASMILSGMGPPAPLSTPAGKIFAGSYALFSGVVFLVIIAVMFSPVIHWFFHRFHIED